MRILIILIGLISITACTNISPHSEPVPKQQHAVNTNQNLIHQHITRLANTLFSSAKNVNINKSVAVGTFLPINLMDENKPPKKNAMGLQIQESFVTLGTQAGLNIIEYKTMSSIKIQPGADVMLSRDTKDLHKEINAQYFLTGTYSEQENSIVVNARLIELSSLNIVAAATDYIPKDYISTDYNPTNISTDYNPTNSTPSSSLHNKQQVTMKNNIPHRKTF